jgi:SAM-dependent methyltransferase
VNEIERREKEFHDRVFEEQTRKPAWKFYAVTVESRAFYESLVRRHGARTTALDYGCGRGANSRLLATVAERVVAIDISSVALAKTKERIRNAGTHNVHFSAMNAEMLALAPASFHLICGTAVIHHLDLDRALPELARVLRPDGTAVFLEPLGHNPIINIYRRLTPSFRTVDEHPLKVADLNLTQRFFAQVEAHYFTLLPLLAVPLRRMPFFPALLRFLARADRALFDRMPGLSRYAWQVVILLREPKRRPDAPATEVQSQSSRQRP